MYMYVLLSLSVYTINIMDDFGLRGDFKNPQFSKLFYTNI